MNILDKQILVIMEVQQKNKNNLRFIVFAKVQCTFANSDTPHVHKTLSSIKQLFTSCYCAVNYNHTDRNRYHSYYFSLTFAIWHIICDALEASHFTRCIKIALLFSNYLNIHLNSYESTASH